MLELAYDILEAAGVKRKDTTVGISRQRTQVHPGRPQSCLGDPVALSDVGDLAAEGGVPEFTRGDEVHLW